MNEATRAAALMRRMPMPVPSGVPQSTAQGSSDATRNHHAARCGRPQQLITQIMASWARYPRIQVTDDGAVELGVGTDVPEGPGQRQHRRQHEQPHQV